MPRSLLVTRAGELASLLRLFALDAHMRQAGANSDGAHRSTVADAQSERERILGSVEPHLVQRYQALIERSRLAFIVPVRDGRCTGCIQRLPSALIEALRRPDALAICPRCERMLYARAPHV
jgi:predicted  nucleic acid-binding Zn-ribbon protein